MSNTHEPSNAFSRAVAGLRIISDEEDLARTHTDRKTQLRGTWERVPRRMLRHECDETLAAAADEWTDRGSLVLLGPSRCGKTSAAVRLVARLLRAGVANGGDDLRLGKGILWVRADELTLAGGARDDEAAHKLMHRAEWCRLLVLDDVAKASQTITRVLELRYDRGLPVVITSGASDAKQLAEWMGGTAVLRWALECGRDRKGKIVIGKAKR